MPNGDIFDYPILAPSPNLLLPTTATSNYVYSAFGSTGLFEIQWPTGLTHIVHDTGFFTMSGNFYSGNPLTGGTFIQAAPDVSTPYDASAPEPVSMLLFATAFGVALWVKRRHEANRPAVQPVPQDR